LHPSQIGKEFFAINPKYQLSVAEKFQIIHLMIRFIPILRIIAKTPD